jgi:Spy/CpxP family protein refolding chaperone
MVGKILAADQTPPEGKQKGHWAGAWSPTQRVDRMLKAVTLTDEQKAKVADLKKEYEPKFKELGQKMKGVLTPEQKTARVEAAKAAREAGKSRQDVRAAAEAAMKMTDQQKAKLAEVRKANMSLGKEFRDKVVGLLTPEQKEQLKKLHKHGGEHHAESTASA